MIFTVENKQKIHVSNTKADVVVAGGGIAGNSAVLAFFRTHTFFGNSKYLYRAFPILSKNSCIL